MCIFFSPSFSPTQLELNLDLLVRRTAEAPPSIHIVRTRTCKLKRIFFVCLYEHILVDFIHSGICAPYQNRGGSGGIGKKIQKFFFGYMHVPKFVNAIVTLSDKARRVHKLPPKDTQLHKGYLLTKRCLKISNTLSYSP